MKEYNYPDKVISHAWKKLADEGMDMDEKKTREFAEFLMVIREFLKITGR